MEKISVNTNNKQIMSLTQEQHDGPIILRSGDREETICLGDLVMLMNYYRNCKYGTEVSDYIRP